MYVVVHLKTKEKQVSSTRPVESLDINMALRGEGNICTKKFANWDMLSLISVESLAKEAFWQEEYSLQEKCITTAKCIEAGGRYKFLIHHSRPRKFVAFDMEKGHMKEMSHYPYIVHCNKP